MDDGRPHKVQKKRARSAIVRCAKHVNDRTKCVKNFVILMGEADRCKRERECFIAEPEGTTAYKKG